MSSEFKPFRLQNLPFLALREVFRNFAPLEIFDLSLCSKKMAKIAKIDRNHRKMQFQLTIDHEIVLSVYKPDDPDGTFAADFALRWSKRTYDASVREMNGMNFIFKRVVGKTLEISQWKTKEDAVEGASYYFEVIFDLFNIKYWHGFVDKNCNKNNYLTIRDWIRQIQSKIGGELMIIDGHRLEEMVKYETDGRNFWNFHDKLQIPHWIAHKFSDIKINNLLELRFITLTLKNSSLSDEDLNILIPRLLTQCDERIEVIDIKVKRRIDRMNVLNGIPFWSVEQLPPYKRYGWDESSQAGYQVECICGMIWSIVFKEEAPFDQILIYPGGRADLCC